MVLNKSSKFTPSIPDELWMQIFSYLCIYDAVSSVDELLDPFVQRYPQELVQENMKTKRAIALVNRHFHSLCMNFVFEMLFFRDAGHLHSFIERMRESPELTKTIQLRTKILEVAFIVQPNLSGIDPLDCIHPETHEAASRRSLVDVDIIFQTCINLKQLVCCFSSSMFFNDGLNIGSSSLRYFAWKHAPLMPLRSLLPSLKELRTLDLSITSMVKVDDDIDIPELPFLHTIRGPLNIICPLLGNSNLPALRTVIACRYRAKAVPSLKTFFDNHGSKLKSLALDHTCDVPDFPPLAACPNLEDLVVDWAHLFSMQLPLRKLARLGLVFNPVKGLPPVLVILYNLEIFENYVDRFPDLRTIQIVESRVSSHLLKMGPNALRLRQRRLRGHGVELRNEAGGILIV